MKVAVMQPYLFPYIGYFQLLFAADKFVFYDDVQYIKGGWINRNKIVVNGAENIFTVPLKKASPNKLINEIKVHDVLYKKWVGKFLKTVEQAYSGAPFIQEVLPIIQNTLYSENQNISHLAMGSIRNISTYLELDKEFFVSSEHFSDSLYMGRALRLIHITKELDSKIYLNSSGGKKLYDKKEFFENGLKLKFLEPQTGIYDQFGEKFFPGMSILDVLMFNSKSEVKDLLKNYQLS